MIDLFRGLVLLGYQSVKGEAPSRATSGGQSSKAPGQLGETDGAKRHFTFKVLVMEQVADFPQATQLLKLGKSHQNNKLERGELFDILINLQNP